MAQSGDLGRVMDELSKESEAEHDDVREDLERRREQERARFEELGEADDAEEEGAAEKK